MLWSAFQADAWTGKPPVLILGGDSFLSSEAVEACRNSLLEKEPGLVQERVEHPRQEFSRALELFTLYGLWGDKREIEYIGEDLSEPQRQAMIRLAGQYLGDNYLLVRLSSWRAWMEKLPDSILAVDCTAPARRDQLKDWLMAQASRRKIRLSSSGAEEMLERLGEALGVLENALTLMELSKDAAEAWDEARVSAFFSHEAEADIFQYAEAVASRNLKKSLESIRLFLAWGKSPAELIGGLRYYLRNLLMLKMNPRLSAQAAWDKLRIRRDKYPSMRRLADRYDLAQLRKMFVELYNLDRDSKMSDRDKDLLEMFTLRLFLELKQN